MTEADTPSWESARLIPVSGIRSAEEQERRATSALLAVISSVEEFGFYGLTRGNETSPRRLPTRRPTGRLTAPVNFVRYADMNQT